MNLTAAGIDLVKQAERLRLTPYRCPAGVLTIGYGHTSVAGSPKVAARMRITAEDADAILRRDLADVACRIRPMIVVGINDNQFSALVSFAFNCGVGTFSKSSVRRLVNAGAFDEVPRALAMYVRGGGRILPGLVRRRAAEGELWRS